MRMVVVFSSMRIVFIGMANIKRKVRAEISPGLAFMSIVQAIWSAGMMPDWLSISAMTGKLG